MKEILMKKKVLIIAGVFIALLLICGTGYYLMNNKKVEPIADNTKEGVQNIQKLIFGQADDYKAAGVELGMDLTETKKILGNPEEEVLEPGGGVHADVKVLTYQFGEFSFIEDESAKGMFNLFDITIETKGYAGPRDIKIGDSMASVLDKFPNKESTIVNGEKKIYEEDKKYGSIIYDDKGNPICITFFNDSESSLIIDLSEKKVSRIMVSWYII